ncbi:MAG: hypothetical protein ACYS7Y_04430 [Planctomycetota bacterium]|jgi:hypothetical protein
MRHKVLQRLFTPEQGEGFSATLQLLLNDGWEFVSMTATENHNRRPMGVAVLKRDEEIQ